MLINTGINGFIGMGVILCSGGDLNGPTLGGIFAIMGFSSYGKHMFNIVPVMAGVLLGSIVMSWHINDSAVQLADVYKRQVGGLNATRVCALLGGGGHAAAAGCTVRGSIEDAQTAILEAIRTVEREG